MPLPELDVVDVGVLLLFVSVGVCRVCVGVGLAVGEGVSVVVGDVAVVAEGDGDGDGVAVVMVAGDVVGAGVELTVVVPSVPVDPPHPARVTRQTRTRANSDRCMRGLNSASEGFSINVNLGRVVEVSSVAN